MMNILLILGGGAMIWLGLYMTVTIKSLGDTTWKECWMPLGFFAVGVLAVVTGTVRVIGGC